VRLSRKGARFIARFEGFVPTAYNDVADNATIGFGHLLHYGPTTAADRRLRWSRRKALRALREDASMAAAAVRAGVKVSMQQCEFDALVSFTFNVGIGGFKSSTVLRKLNEGHRHHAAEHLLDWVYAGGVVVEGLYNRRAAEKALFEEGVYK
jgi:lysozyme